jgi:hypothetical protein
MKLSSDTTQVLKNFSTINQGIFIKSGKTLKTVSAAKNILAEATVADDFPTSFGIYDLNGFLSLLSLSKDPDLEFEEKNILINALSGRSKIKYRYTEPTMIVTPPEKSVNFASVDTTFTLSQEDFEWILKSASVLQTPHVAFVSDGAKVYAEAYDVANDSAHSNSTEISPSDGKVFRVIFKVENLKMISGTYTVTISKNVAKFENTNRDIKYWIAAEVGSTME